MSLNDIMALLIVVTAAAVLVVDIVLAVKYPSQRWIRIPRGVAAGWVAVVFLFNLIGAWVGADGNSVPILIGRSAMLLMISTILAGAIYSLRSKGIL